MFGSILSKIDRHLSRVKSKNIGVKILSAVATWILVFIPIYIYFILKAAVDPIGFWQNIVLLLVCGMAIGWLQVFLIIVGFFITEEIFQKY